MRFVTSLLVLIIAATPAAAQFNPDHFTSLTARNIGPAGMSGRVAAVEVIPGDPPTILVGAATGGIWKSDNGGITWEPIFDDQTPSIGSIAVSPTNPDLIWVGTGEGNPRNSAGVGRGMYKSVDGGRSWQHLGLEHSERIHRVIAHPTDPDIAYAGVLGPSWSDGEERGVYRTTDGGASWERVLFTNPRAGASDLVMDTENPDKLYAGMWEHRRYPWFFESGGPGSGLFVTYDGGDNWTQLTKRDGLPPGTLGRIGLAVGVNEPDVVYALVEAEDAALLRSDDGGVRWETIREGPGTAPRPFYYADIRVDPTNENRIYNLHSRIEVSEDQGRTFTLVVPSQKIHGDVQDLWIGETGRFLVMGNDGGIGISFDRGDTWRFVENLPLAQFYHINVDMDTPFNVYGGLQDNGSWFGPSHIWRDGPIRNYDWTRVGGGDGFATMTDFANDRFGFTQSQGGNIRRFDKLTGERMDVKPVHPDGTPLRFNWNAATNVDPFDSSVIYIASQFVHRSPDRGSSWEIISPDLTTNDPEKQRWSESGGLTTDASGAELHTSIITVAPSPVERGVIWVGTDDGNVQVTRDGGSSWENVVDRIRGVPANTWVPHIEPSKFDGATAFVAFDNHRRGDGNPYLFKTDNHGRSWTSLVTDGIDGFIHVVEQDPVEPDLLFVGTEFWLHVSLDGGDSWHRWTGNGLPSAPYRAILVHPRDGDLVAGTHGRAVYVVDDIQPLRALAASGGDLPAGLHLFDIPDTYQHTRAESMMGGYRSTGDAMFGGTNRAYGAMISFWAPTAGETASVVIMSGTDTVNVVEHETVDGVNRATWNLRSDGYTTPGAMRNGTTRGPEVLPGVYQVTVNIGDETATGSLEVRADPRHQFTLADQRTKADALRHVGLQMERAADVMDAARAARSSLRSALGDAEDPRLKERGEMLTGVVEAIGNRIVARAQPGERPDRTLIGARLQAVYQSMQSSFGPATGTQMMVIEQTQEQLDAVVSAFNGFLSNYETLRTDAAAAGLGELTEIPRVP